MSTFQESLKKYLDLYSGQEMYFVNDTRNLEFFKANSSNTKLEDIQQKLSIMNDADFNRLGAQEPMAKHILELNIDPRLAKNDLSVVSDIAHITLNGKEENLLHFASVYCNLHKPDVFPIYSDQFADFYRRYIKEYKLNINPDELNKYDVFAKAQDDLITRYGVKGKMNFLQMRKFAWLYMEKVLKEANPLVSH
jgi:hypothetical protein